MNTEIINKKAEYWEKQLLDLGKRNKMISFRETKRSTLKILEPNYECLFKRLVVNEEELTFQKLIGEDGDLRVYSVLSLMDSLSAPVEVTLGEIKPSGSLEEAQKTLKELRNKARLSLDEQGINILYLVFGFIEWKEKASNSDWVKSPLILVPVSIVLESLNAPFILKKYEDDLVVNPTLAYLFERDYGIILPEFDPDEGSIEEFMIQMEKLADMHGWRIFRETSIGLVSFLKISMYKDLLNNREKIQRHPIIRAFAGDRSALNEHFVCEMEFDHDNQKSTQLFQVVDADSSQQDAILLSQKGISFVMQGPPGTGKSQTITNMIAQGLADGKKILFVSEKMAALEVVYRRLEEVHLSDFCLPLHSHKANKKEILNQLGENLELKHIKVKEEEIAKLTRLDVLREELRCYVQDLHRQIMPLEMSLYEVYGEIVQLQELPDFRLALLEVKKLSKDDVNRLNITIENLEKFGRELGNSKHDNPWKGLVISRLGNVQKQVLKETISDLIGIIKDEPQLMISGGTILQWCKLDDIPSYFSSYQLAKKCALAPSEWMQKDLTKEKFAIEELVQKKRRFEEQYVDMMQFYDERIFYMDQEEFTVQFREKCRGLQTFLKNDYTYDELYDSYAEIRNSLQQSYDPAMKLAQFYSKLSQAYTQQEHGTLDQIEKMLRVSEILLEKEKITQEILEIEKSLLKEYEPSVLDLEYKPMLDRFKTEYNGFFKIFKSQYRKDKKQLRLFSRTVGKITDLDVVDLLYVLRERDELLQQKRDKLKHAATVFNQSEFADISSCCSKSEILEIRNLMAFIKEFNEKFPNMDQNEIHQLPQEIMKVQIVVDELEKIIQQMKAYLKVEKNYAQLMQGLDEIKQLRHNEEMYHEALAQAHSLFDFISMDDEHNWNLVEKLIEDIEELKILPSKTTVSQQWISFIMDRNNGVEIGIILRYLEQLSARQEMFTSFCSKFDETHQKQLMDFSNLMNKLQSCSEQFEMMDAWIEYRDCKLICQEKGLFDFVEQSEHNFYPEGRLKDVFQKAFYISWIDAQTVSMKSVRNFNAAIHCDRIDQFRELDRHQLPVAQMRIREKLISSMPDKSTFLRNGDEMSLLLRELNKKRRNMALRKLFQSIPNLLLKLKPCLMMSPLSVSYFLEADTYHFDMVIFDEASQIFPQDAIGAIFRGSQIIIAGDSKQLPPTNFFSKSTNNDFDYDKDDEDFDEIVSGSILEEAGSTLLNRSLLWHYRSRNEELISFSNREIYGNHLITFPCSKICAQDSGVEYIYVEDGVYENQCNLEEAVRCVDLIEQHIKKHPDRTLGVIAFSESQQSTIEDALHKFRKKHPEYEEFFSEEKEEPFFIKNLENVQGDERDTILFSICYAKNAQGRMYMRFGPLGHQGGERRLNVAITRAKHNVKLIGSILPQDIDLNRITSEGVRLLRAYIEFASKSHKESVPIKKKNALYETDVFSNLVAQFLEEKGYRVKRNIGTSEYTVDMAIEHPQLEGLYVAGIECDGDSYQMARTVRDRDHLRTMVMHRMGWNMYRVWSSEWIQNEQRAKQKLLAFVEEALTEEFSYDTYDYTEEKITEVQIETEESVSDAIHSSVDVDNPYELELYQERDWSMVSSSRGDDEDAQIAGRLHGIIKVEQPIHLEVLYRRISGFFGNSKVTSSIRKRVNTVLRTKMSSEIKMDAEYFITLSDFSSVKVRRSFLGIPDRNIGYISMAEIEEAIKIVLTGAYGVELSALFLETAKIFGFEKVGSNIRKRMSDAIESLKAKELIKVTDNRVQLLEN